MRHELQGLLKLTERVGRDPLLTQASTGNSSAKLDGVLWIKASGKWMADALRDDILMPLNLEEVLNECRRQVDPAERYSGASLETALHATLPHRMVLHLHCINTIAWAVRSDAETQLKRLLEGLAWRWIPYIPSGLPLSHAISSCPDNNLFVLGNHGLVICGDDAASLEDLLNEVRRRLTISPRKAPAADHNALREVAQNSHWRLPEDGAVHALGTDAISRKILTNGVLYPCQAIFSSSANGDPPFRIVEGRGVVVNKNIRPAELAMVSGLAQVVQRLSPAAPLRYLTGAEIAAIPCHVADRYRELANIEAHHNGLNICTSPFGLGSSQ